MRYRFEYVEEDAFEDDSYASTLRTALGYETASYEGFSAGVEFQDVSVIGNPDAYNSTCAQRDHREPRLRLRNRCQNGRQQGRP